MDAGVIAVQLALGGAVFVVFGEIPEGAGPLDLGNALGGDDGLAVPDFLFDAGDLRLGQFMRHDSDASFSFCCPYYTASRPENQERDRRNGDPPGKFASGTCIPPRDVL